MKKDVFDELVVVKRSGQRVGFNNYKIAVAIKQAFDNVYDFYNEKEVNNVYAEVLKHIEQNYHDRKTINVEDIQDIIENILKEAKYLEVFEAFSQYRQKRAASRKVFTIKQQHKFLKAMEKIVDDDSLLRENSYKSYEIINKYGKTVVNEFTKSYIIDNKFLRAHQEGGIFIHDMELFPLGILSSIHLNLNEIFKKNNTLDEIIINLLKAKFEIKGEINIPGLDYLLEEYTLNKYKNIIKENLINYLKVTGFYNYINIKKLLETIDKEHDLIINLDNYNQFIYSDIVKDIFNQAYDDSINKIKETLLKELTKLFELLNKEKNFGISLGTNESNTGQLINKIIFEILETNLPFNNLKIIYKINKSNIEYLNYIIKLLKLNSEIILTFIDNSYNKNINEIEYFADGIRIFENINSINSQSLGRMVVAKTSLNINRLSLKHNNSLSKFYQELEETLELVKCNLLLSFETIGNKNKDNYRILFNDNVFDDEKLETSQKIRKVIKNGTLLIGIVGLKEAVISLSPDESKQFKLLTEILKFLNKKCDEFTQDTKLNFAIYEPSELLVRKEFMALDKSIYGINKNITDETQYDLITNLSSIKDDYNKLGLIQKAFVGGSVLEINLSSNSSSKKILELIDKLILNDIEFVKIKLGKKGD